MAEARTYETVVDTCQAHGWQCKLSKGKHGWQLDIWDGDDLIARGRSKTSPPHCFRRLGETVGLALTKSGKL